MKQDQFQLLLAEWFKEQKGVNFGHAEDSSNREKYFHLKSRESTPKLNIIFCGFRLELDLFML